MSNVWKTILEILAASGGGAIIALTIVKIFAKNILEHSFEKLIENYKYKLNLEFDRISKLNQKEFEILPLLWDKVTHHRSMVLFYASEVKLFENLNQYNDNSLELFLNELPIPDYHKYLIKTSEDKNRAYIDVITVNGSETIRKHYYEFDKIYKSNKIFFTKNISEVLAKIHKYYFEANNIYLQIIGDSVDRKIFWESFDNRSQKLLDDFSGLIKKRLRFLEE